MEETLRIVFSVFVAIVIMFVFPLYIAFEKRDDVAYSMALKMTSELVENVRNKGYISSKMYSDFESKLVGTGNTYEIKMEHRSNKVYPDITYNENKEKIVNYKYIEEVYNEKQILPVIRKDISKYATKDESNNALNLFFGMDKDKYKNTTLINELNYGYLYMYGISDILQYDDLRKLPIYTMNIGDTFNITVKNTNTSIATRIFQIITGSEDAYNNNVRVYVNYGGTILNEEYEI